jgi:hypothetical protein
VRCCVHGGFARVPRGPEKASVETPATDTTIITATALFPSLVAVIVAFPIPTAATTPELETVALEESDVDHKKGRRSCWPDASWAVAVSWTVAVGAKVAVSTEMMTVAVGGGGPITLSLPAQERMSQPRASDQMKRGVVFVSEPLVTGRTR